MQDCSLLAAGLMWRPVRLGLRRLLVFTRMPAFVAAVVEVLSVTFTWSYSTAGSCSAAGPASVNLLVVFAWELQ
jgi:hypothetical protein